MTKTYLDAGVLLKAWRGIDSEADLALKVMEDTQRIHFTSYFGRLELLPKAIYFKQRDEVEFYEAHFDRSKHEIPFSKELALRAIDLAKKHGLAAADALHVAAGIMAGADEFITTEGPEKPIFRVKEIKMQCLDLLGR
jgi:predicted nucleic acid-binding protein